ncbi:diguanylate cyclase [Arsukibacterium ikkense]|uniref:Diguanylate cyclase n=2 Tax=Arsukibacterium ikkense TaxID=336831 RepID=A0A0M2V762_9GAMM|nr:diguanylate cyclase [Arsukibacterium ikkense]
MRFISLPKKILLLTLLLMLVLLTLLTSMSLQRLNENFFLQQQQKQQQVQQHFNQYQQLLQQQQQVWVEAFAEVSGLLRQDSFQPFLAELERQLDAISIHLNIENLWFFGPDGQQHVLHATVFPAQLEPMVQYSFSQQRPGYQLHCGQSCSSMLSMPLANGGAEVAVIVISRTLADVVLAIGQSMQGEVAIVELGSDTGVTLLSSSGKVALPVLNTQRAALTHALHNSEGLRFTDNGKQYFAHVLPLVVQPGQQYALLLLEDISRYLAANRRFQWQLIGLALLCFMTFGILIYALTQRLSQRLLGVSRALPMLAQSRFQRFRQLLPKPSRWLADEVDNLHNASLTLSQQLEQLQDNVAQQTRELENMAMFDLLTGLANRNMLQFQLKKRLAALAAERDYLGLLFLDVDQFKRVNDIRGHEQGDLVLLEAAQRLRNGINKADLACRFGGDEFVVACQVSNPDQLEALAIKLITAFAEPMRLQGDVYQLGVSIGISYTRDNNLQPDDLVRQADLAMYQAKARGGNCLHFYSQQMFDHFQNRLALENELKHALAQQQFAIHLQPKIMLDTQRLQGFEVLLRWQSPSRGMVPPDEFISILEYARLMIPVGYWVIEQSFLAMQQLQHAGYADITIAINLSAEQLMDKGLPSYLDTLLQQYHLQASNFELELTESLLAQNIQDTITTMHQLKAMGFLFAIDDFGTGYSSLSYLRQMPVDTIKIDKSFVFGMLDNQADFDIITSTIAMVKKLGLAVVAEGVETQAQCRMLKAHQCDIAQGYLFSKPVAASQLLAHLQANLDERRCWR